MRTFVLVAVCWASCSVALAQDEGVGHCRVSVVAAPGSEAGRMLVGVRFACDPGWHVYWKNPGDSGGPPVLKWRLPPGFRVVRTEWPVPKRLDAAGVVSYVLEGSPTLLVELETPVLDRQIRHALFSLDVTYLVCSDVCDSGASHIEEDLMGLGKTLDVAVVRATLPTIGNTDGFSFRLTDGIATLGFDLKDVDLGGLKSATFFPAQGATLDHGTAQTWQVQGHRLVLTARASRFATGPIKRPEGVLVLELAHGTLAFEYVNSKSQEKEP